ncbi:MAG: hypothetical protein IT352_03960 [Gemmatimonadales bacterium]|nr:hypothetical protein [Gemmatimonadales bacterium]
MAYYHDLKPDPMTFEERLGTPGALEAALGLLVIHFQELEAVIVEALGRLLATRRRDVAALTAEMSFKARIHALASLYRIAQERETDPESADNIARLDELLGRCLFLEGERNRYVHSFWPGSQLGSGRALRLKRVSRKDGFNEQRDVVLASDLLDRSDYAQYLSTEVEQFFGLPMGAPDRRASHGGN